MATQYEEWDPKTWQKGQSETAPDPAVKIRRSSYTVEK